MSVNYQNRVYTLSPLPLLKQSGDAIDCNTSCGKDLVFKEVRENVPDVMKNHLYTEENCCHAGC